MRDRLHSFGSVKVLHQPGQGLHQSSDLFRGMIAHQILQKLLRHRHQLAQSLAPARRDPHFHSPVIFGRRFARYQAIPLHLIDNPAEDGLIQAAEVCNGADPAAVIGVENTQNLPPLRREAGATQMREPRAIDPRGQVVERKGQQKPVFPTGKLREFDGFLLRNAHSQPFPESLLCTMRSSISSIKYVITYFCKGLDSCNYI